MRALGMATAGLLLLAAGGSAQEPPAPTPKPAPAARPRPRPTPTPGPPDVYHLDNGDRVSGRTLSRTARGFAVQTPFGRLNLPRARVRKIVLADGTEEVLDAARSPAAAAAPLPAPTPPAAAGSGRLTLAITGKKFWQAWDPKQTGRDPTLRLELRLDEDPLAVYSDAELDPDEIPGAAVNAFSFTSDMKVSPAPRVRVHPADVRPGRIVLKLDVPAASPAPRRLRLAYQMNTGTPEAPAWKDLVSGGVDLTLGPNLPSLVEVKQDRGRMEFSGLLRRKMKNVETFQLDLSASASPVPAP
jgi:hypothetical protein